MKRAAEGLVSAAKTAADNAADDMASNIPTTQSVTFAKELEATEAIVRKERELQRAREELIRLRKQKYGGQ